jgi:hypothetical protein
MENLPDQINRNPLVSQLDKDFHFISLPTLNTLAEEIKTNSQNFVLFLGMDARTVNDSTIMTMADKLFSKGLAYLCAWGGDCNGLNTYSI